MARTITFDFATGGVATAGRVTMTGTNIYTTGTTVNLPPVKVAYLAGGLASIPNVEPTPVAADGWRYQVKLESDDGTTTFWVVSVPDATTPIGFGSLPVIEATTLPLGATGTSLETWLQSVRAQAAAANANATAALQQIQDYHGVDAGPPVFTTADTWEQLKMIVMSDGTIKGIPVGDNQPAQPVISSATPGSTLVRILWSAIPQATTYRLFRNGLPIYYGETVGYTDWLVTGGTTYTYMLIAYDRHGQRSMASTTVDAGPNPSLNVAPFVQITTWPSPLPQSGTGIIRVAASDAEAQDLAITLAVSVGTITPTRDPSVWKFTS